MGLRKIGALTLLVLGAGAGAAGAATCGGHGTRETLFVSTKWLADHMHDVNLVVLAVGEKSEYDAEHIAGSQYIDFHSIGVKGENGLILELPPMDKLAETFSKLGVSNDSRIVVYRLKDWLTPAARVILTLDAMGLGKNAAMLDGSLATWKEEGRALAKEAPVVKPGKLTPCPQDDVIANLEFVKSNLHQPGVRILDARDPKVYSGETARPGAPAGHIQGAGNVHYDSLLDEKTGKLKPVEDLQTRFRDAGVKPGDRVVTYCFIGQQASALYLISRYLGYDTRLYDGSWDEWTKHPELPTETAANVKR
jgi:thiosulfate/3-mercaptopyruvate sulfurtransferase